MIRSGMKKQPIADRFWRFVSKSDDCWEWTGSLKTGYGQFSIRHGRNVPAHRFSYELVNGPIPDGLFICHKCDNKRCVRPSHLFAGSQLDNMRDAAAKGILPGPNANITRCLSGRHELTPENLYWCHGRRTCKACMKERGARNYQKRRAAALARAEV